MLSKRYTHTICIFLAKPRKLSIFCAVKTTYHIEIPWKWWVSQVAGLFLLFFFVVWRWRKLGLLLFFVYVFEVITINTRFHNNGLINERVKWKDRHDKIIILNCWTLLYWMLCRWTDSFFSGYGGIIY